MNTKYFIVAFSLMLCCVAKAQDESGEDNWWIQDEYINFDDSTILSNGKGERVIEFPVYRSGMYKNNPLCYSRILWRNQNVRNYLHSYYVAFSVKEGDFVVIYDKRPAHSTTYSTDFSSRTNTIIRSGRTWNNGIKFTAEADVVAGGSNPHSMRASIYKSTADEELCADVGRWFVTQLQYVRTELEEMVYDFVIDRYGAQKSMTLITPDGGSIESYLEAKKEDFSNMSNAAIIHTLSSDLICKIVDRYDRTIYVACPEICWSISSQGWCSYEPYFFPLTLSSYKFERVYEWEAMDEDTYWYISLGDICHPSTSKDAVLTDDDDCDVYATKGELISESGSEFYVYTLQGGLVGIADGKMETAAGLYLVRQGTGKAIKLLVK